MQIKDLRHAMQVVMQLVDGNPPIGYVRLSRCSINEATAVRVLLRVPCS